MASIAKWITNLRQRIKNTYGTGCFCIMNTGEKIVKSKNKMLTSFTKHYDVADFQNYGIDKLDPEYFMISTGIDERNFSNLCDIIEFTKCKYFR